MPFPRHVLVLTALFVAACDDPDEGPPDDPPSPPEDSDPPDVDTGCVAVPEVFGDDVDQDCDGEDWWIVTDEGRDAVELGPGEELATIVLDTTPCEGLTWGLEVRRPARVPPAVPGTVHVEAFDGAAWIELRVEPVEALDIWEFATWFERVSAPGLTHPTFQLRVRVSEDLPAGEVVVVDDLFVACAGEDLDHDTYGTRLDCDDLDDAHWSDCGTCVDLDGDEYGEGCDRGADCDDGDAGRAPDLPDPAGDGVDQDCSGMDDFHDDFESGSLQPNWPVWGASGVTDDQAHTGIGSLLFDGQDLTLAVSDEIDTSGCDTVDWEFWILLPSSAAPGEPAGTTLEWWNGFHWPDLVRAESTLVVPVWEHFSGTIIDPWVAHDDFTIRFAGLELQPEQRLYVDDVVVRCGPPDADGDGVFAEDDCDDTDPAHWSDCQGGCLSADGDDHGPGCDQGDDCNDADGTVYPGAPDPFGDGVDASCDGLDGPVWADGFEASTIDPTLWQEVDPGANTGDAVLPVVLFAHTGAQSVQVAGDFTGLESVAVDTSSCPAVAWSYAVKRGADDGRNEFTENDAPRAGDTLTVSYWTGADWTELDVWPGVVWSDPFFEVRSGVVDDPTAIHATFALEFETETSAPYYLDDVFVACTEPDADGDGVVPVFDCDDGDAAHWSDCGTCIDLDLDDHGDGCDAGSDCEDGNAAIRGDAGETDGDGVDSNCDGYDDASVLSDDFDASSELDPTVWASASAPVLGLGVTGFYSTSGDHSFRMPGQSVARTVPLDARSCAEIGWSMEVMRGPHPCGIETPDRFVLSWVGDDGAVVETFVLAGVLIDDTGFNSYTGLITDPAAFWSDFAVELWVDAPNAVDYENGVLVDDLSIACLGPP